MKRRGLRGLGRDGANRFRGNVAVKPIHSVDHNEAAFVAAAGRHAGVPRLAAVAVAALFLAGIAAPARAGGQTPGSKNGGSVAAIVTTDVARLVGAARSLILDIGASSAAASSYSAFGFPPVSAVASRPADTPPARSGWGFARAPSWSVSAGTLGLSAESDLTHGCRTQIAARTALALTPGNPPWVQLYSPNAPRGRTVAWRHPFLLRENLVSGSGIRLRANISNTYWGGSAVDGNGSLLLAGSSVLGDSSGGLTLGGATTSGRVQFGANVDLASPDAVTLGAGGGLTARMGVGLALYADYHATLPPGAFLSQTVSAGLDYKF